MAYGVNAPFGLQPRRMLTGANYNGQTNTYYIASGYKHSIFTGDPVTLLYGGTIGLAEPGKPIIGVFQGCFFVPGSGQTGYPKFQAYWQADTVTFKGLPVTAAVIDDPNVVYDIQVGGEDEPSLKIWDLNKNANFARGEYEPGKQVMSGQSVFYLDYKSLKRTAKETAEFNLKILHLTPRPGNIAGIPFNNVEVIINNHLFKGGTGTAGTNKE